MRCLDDKYEVVTVDTGYKVYMKLHIKNIVSADIAEYRFVKDTVVLNVGLDLALILISDVWRKTLLEIPMDRFHYMVGGEVGENIS